MWRTSGVLCCRCITLHGIILHCSALHCIALSHIALQSIASSWCSQVYDVAQQRRISFVERPAGAPPPEGFKPHLQWASPTELVIGCAPCASLSSGASISIFHSHLISHLHFTPPEDFNTHQQWASPSKLVIGCVLYASRLRPHPLHTLHPSFHTSVHTAIHLISRLAPPPEGFKRHLQ